MKNWKKTRRPRFESLESRQLLAAATTVESPLSFEEVRDLNTDAEVLVSETAAVSSLQRSSFSDEVTSNVTVKYWEGRRDAGAGALVRIYNNRGSLVTFATTNSDGRAKLTYRPSGAFRAVVDLETGGRRFHGHFDFTGRVSRSLWLQEVVTRPSNRPTAGRNSITVTVEDGRGRETVSGAVVHLLDHHGNTLEAYKSNASGQVSFWDLGEQQYSVKVCSDDGGNCSLPRGAKSKDFASTGSRRWTPIVWYAEDAPSRALVIQGQRDQFIGSYRGGVARGADYGSSELKAKLSWLGCRAVDNAEGVPDHVLLDHLRAGMAAGGRLATRVVATLFDDWSAALPQARYTRGVSKESATLIQDGGSPIRTHVLRHGEGSKLSKEVSKTAQFRQFSREVSRAVGDAIRGQAASGRIDLDAIDVSAALTDLPNFGPSPSAEGIRNWFRSPSVLSRIVGGLQGAAAKIENFRILNRGADSNARVRYAADLVIVLGDDFGVDNSDMHLADIGSGVDPRGARGLRAQWILQHHRDTAAPFVNEIVVRVPVRGRFKLPTGYDEVRNLTR